MLICPPTHEWAGAKGIDASQLEDQGFVIREEGSGTREVFEAAMKAYGIKWKTVGVFNSAEAIINAVHCGLGLSFISRLAVQNAKRKFNIVYHRNKFYTNAMREFTAYCLKFFEKVEKLI